MPSSLEWSFIAAAVTGAVIAILGLSVGALGKFRRRHAAFALYAVSFGVGVLVSSLSNLKWSAFDLLPEPPIFFVIEWLATTTVAASLIGLVWLLRTTGPAVRGDVWWTVAASLVTAAVWFAIAASIDVSHYVDLQEARWHLYPTIVEFGLRDGGMVAVGALFAWRARRLSGQEARDNALLGGAILLYPIMHMMGWAFDTQALFPGAYMHAFTAFATALLLVCMVLWVHAYRQTKERPPLVVAWMLPLIGSLAMLAGANYDNAISPPSVARVIEAILISFALARGSFPGLDTRLRWGISKTTLAAIFLAVFFVVSESAAAIFSERWGTEIGIAAAGALVFGIAPIMRWADRFAAKAVPGDLDREGIYLESVRVAMKDGVIDPEEELGLARLGDNLELSGTRRLELHREAESQ